MKKKLTVFILVIFAVFAFSGCALADFFLGSSHSIDDGFVVDRVRTEIKVDENGSAFVTENVDVRFLKYCRGIIRDLPTGSGETYSDIEVNTQYADGQGTVPNNYFITTSYGFISINTGTSGNQTSIYYGAGVVLRYTFSYKINPSNKYASAENYYMNIVGTGWAVAQEDIRIDVSFPNAIKELSFPYGERGSESKVNYKVEGGSLVLQSDSNESVLQAVLTSDKSFYVQAAALPPYYGITVQASIDGKLGDDFDLRVFLAILAAVIFISAIILIWLLKRQSPVVEVVSFYPPDDNGKKINPAEAGMLIDNTCSPADITSLIFYWAANGNLQIKGSDDEKKEKKGEDLTLIKLNELPSDAPSYEKQMYTALFNEKSRVSVDSLKDKFYIHISRAQTSVKAKYHGKLHLTGFSLFMAGLSILLPFLGYLLYGLTLGAKLFLWKGIFAAIPVAVVYFICFARAMTVHKLKDRAKKWSIIGLAVLTVAIGIVSAFFITDALPHLFTVPLNLAATAGAFFAPLLIKQTDYYRDILGRLVGFKNFLASAEKDRLEALLAENPQYYYDILPYANVLGVSDIWENKFKDLTFQSPTYYYSPYATAFNILVFNRLYRNMNSNIKTSVTSRPSNSGRSGGGFGGGGSGRGGFGGGFSGGGFGGGGGRSR